MKTSFKTLPDGRVPHPQIPPKSAHSSHEQLLPEIFLKPTELPSRGLAYPKGCEISYRPYTFGEIQKISQSKFNNKAKLSFVMQGIQCYFDKEEMTLADIAYVALLRKISTIGGHKVNVSFKCQKCHQACTEVLDFGTAQSKIEFHDLIATELPVIITFSNNKDYSFKPLTFKKFAKIIEQNCEDDTIALISHQCVDADYKDVYKVIENATYEDQVLLEELDKLLEHNIKPVSIVCHNKPCNFENKVELAGVDALLLPFREHKKSPSSRIRFGSKASH